MITVPRRADDERSGGTAFGLLVHDLLARAPFGATRSDLEDRAVVEARVLGLDDADGRAAAAVVERLFAHDLLTRARAADLRGACRRETAVTCMLPDGTMVEGVVDLAFEDAGVWTVVDYKTDRDLMPLDEAQYRRQVALYASAIAQATGQPANGVLLQL